MAERINFTKANIEALPRPDRDRTYYYDTKTPGLAVCVTATGNKTFYVYKRVNGRPERVLIGKYPTVPPELARQQAARVLAQIAQGVSPQEQKRLARQEATLRDLYDTYLETHAKLHKRSWKDDESLWRRHLEPWANRRLSGLTQADVQKLHTRIGKDHPIGANRMLALLSVMFNKFGRQYGCTDNPVEGIQRFRERSRDRFMDGGELRRFFDALKQEPEDWQELFLIALLTGARRGNVCAMRWQDLDLVRGLWRVPGEQSKNGEPLVVILVDAVVALLRGRRDRLAESPSPYVWPSWGPSGHISEPKKAWARVIQRAAIQDLRLHDLRRTLGSWQASLGASLPIIGRALGHKSQQATAIYARLQLDSVRQSVNAATAAIIAAGNGSTANDGKPEVVAEQDALEARA